MMTGSVLRGTECCVCVRLDCWLPLSCLVPPCAVCGECRTAPNSFTSTKPLSGCICTLLASLSVDVLEKPTRSVAAHPPLDCTRFLPVSLPTLEHTCRRRRVSCPTYPRTDLLALFGEQESVACFLSLLLMVVAVDLFFFSHRLEVTTCSGLRVVNDLSPRSPALVARPAFFVRHAQAQTHNFPGKSCVRTPVTHIQHTPPVEPLPFE